MKIHLSDSLESVGLDLESRLILERKYGIVCVNELVDPSICDYVLLKSYFRENKGIKAELTKCGIKFDYELAKDELEERQQERFELLKNRRRNNGIQLTDSVESLGIKKCFVFSQLDINSVDDLLRKIGSLPPFDSKYIKIKVSLLSYGYHSDSFISQSNDKFLYAEYIEREGIRSKIKLSQIIEGISTLQLQRKSCYELVEKCYESPDLDVDVLEDCYILLNKTDEEIIKLYHLLDDFSESNEKCYCAKKIK